jgi:aldehyde reductase
MNSLNLKLNDGNSMPIVGLGTYLSEKGVISRAITDAIDCGYRHIDCAYFYQNQKEIGSAVNKAISDGKVKREELFITSKVFPNWFGKGRVIRCAQLMLQDFDLKYLDLLLLHWPVPFKDDDNELLPKDANGNIAVNNDIDIVDVYKELEEVKKLGLVKSIGISNFNSEQIERLLKKAQIVPVMNQVECHPYLNQEKLLNFCRQRNIELTAYSPLGQGGRKADEPFLLEDEKLKQISAKYSKSVAQVIIKWQTQRGVAVIPKSVTKERIASNIDIFDFTLSDEEMKAINALNRDYRFVKFDSFGLDKHKEWPFRIDF